MSTDGHPASPLLLDRKRAFGIRDDTTRARVEVQSTDTHAAKNNEAGVPGGGLEPPGARVQGVRDDTLPVGVQGARESTLPSKHFSR